MTPSEVDLLRASTLVAISETLAYARERCPRYEGLRVDQIRTFSDFESLPLFTRPEYVKDPRACFARGVRASGLKLTSGTLGPSIAVPVSAAELDACDAYVREAMQPEEGIRLLLTPSHKCFTGVLGRPSDVRASWAFDAAREGAADVWDEIALQLCTELPLLEGTAKISAIHAIGSPGLLLLTNYMLARALDPRETGVRRLVVQHSWVGKRTRARLCETWNAAFFTNWSCAELNHFAVECNAKPGRFHMLESIYPEVIAADTDRPVAVGGEGELVATGLHPYHQACIFVRYRTGDWVRQAGITTCCGGPAYSFDLLGRTITNIKVPLAGGTLVVPEAPIWEALDRFDEIPLLPEERIYRHSVDARGSRPVLRILPKTHVVPSAGARRKLEERMAAAILEQWPPLRAAVQDGPLSLDVHSVQRGRLAWSRD